MGLWSRKEHWERSSQVSVFPFRGWEQVREGRNSKTRWADSRWMPLIRGSRWLNLNSKERNYSDSPCLFSSSSAIAISTSYFNLSFSLLLFLLFFSRSHKELVWTCFFNSLSRHSKLVFFFFIFCMYFRVWSSLVIINQCTDHTSTPSN